MGAVVSCDVEVIKLLLAHGADVHAEIGLTKQEVSSDPCMHLRIHLLNALSLQQHISKQC